MRNDLDRRRHFLSVAKKSIMKEGKESYSKMKVYWVVMRKQTVQTTSPDNAYEPSSHSLRSNTPEKHNKDLPHFYQVTCRDKSEQ